MVHYPQFHTKWLHNMNIFITIHEAAQSASGGAENAGLEMQDVKMQDHVEKRRTSEVRHSEQTRKATSGAVVTPQHCRVTQVMWALMAL